MRITLLLLLVGFCLFPNTIASAEEVLALVHYGQDTGLRERLIRDTAVYADLGGRLVARLKDPAQARLIQLNLHFRTLPEPGPGEWMVSLARVDAKWRPANVRILHEEPDVFLVACRPEAIDGLKRSGIFGGGVLEIPLDRPYHPAPAVSLAGIDAPDPRIQALVGKVQQVNLVTHLTALTTIYTRRAERPENAIAIKYVQEFFAKLPNLTVKTEVFSSSYGPNVIAELRGYEKPDEIVMVGAHIDSTAGSSSNRSPGADDNASGSASVLELARVFASTPMQRTMRFALWNAEERGLVGSYAYARAAKTRGDKIIAYLNTDMNAYRDPSDTTDVDFIRNDSTASLITQLTTISQTYVPTLGVKSGYFSRGTSDHRSFYRQGYPAVFYFEDIDKYSPYIHSSNDDMVRSTNDMNLATLITQSVAAGLATLAMPVPEPSFTLNVATGPSVGGTQVTATGSFLSTTQSVKVGGKAVPFTRLGNTVLFETPVSPALGAVQTEITNLAGTGKAPFTYTLTTPPAIRIPSRLKPGSSGPGAVGGKPGYLTVTLISLLLGKTDMNLVTIDIGNGNPGTLIWYHFGYLSAGGGTVEFPVGVPDLQILNGLTFHFQAAVVEASLKEVLKTNVASLEIK